MRLSVCVIADGPTERVAAAIAPVRAFADEVVVGADPGVGPQTRQAYGELADRVLDVDLQLGEDPLGRLYRQCRGEWVLRLDSDEVPSAAFAGRLPQLLALDVRQVWVRRLWLHRDDRSVLAQPPWSVDMVDRLVRNDGMPELRPAEFVVEPVYHLALLTRSRAQREAMAIRHEVVEPGAQAHGGGRRGEALYLPELRARPLRHARIDRRDEAATGLASDAQPEPAGADARIEVLEEPVLLAPGEARDVLVCVTNLSRMPWQPGLGPGAPVRLGHRWLDQDGRAEPQDGPRSGLPRLLGPGEQLIAPLAVVAPHETGGHAFEGGVLEEGVRWLGQTCRADVVVAAPDLPPTGPRLAPSPPPSGGEVTIPRTFHRVWVGGSPMPERLRAFGETFARLHPHWDMRLWGDEDLADLGITPEDTARARWPSELANLARYEILRRHGGVYLDTDCECLRAFDPLLSGCDAFSGLESEGCVAIGVMGSVPGHPIFERAAAEARRTMGLGAHSAHACGPYFFTLLVEQMGGIRLFDVPYFYPYHWTEPERAGEDFPDSYAVHHWTGSWLPAAG